MILGNTTIGASQVSLGVNEFRLVVLEDSLQESLIPARLSAYMDGLGGAGGDQRVRGVLYVNGVLAAVSTEVVIAAGAAATWVSFPFYTFPNSASSGLLSGTGEVILGLLSGLAAGVARIFYVPSVGTGDVYSRTYVDGPYAAFASYSSPTPDTNYLSIHAVLSPVWAPPGVDVVTDDYYTELGFPSAQQALLLNVASESSVTAIAGWHGTYVDPQRGSVAVVNSSGSLAGHVGERVRVSSRLTKRSVVVLVHAESDLVAEDISLSRRAWLAIGTLSDDELTVSVEVLA